VNPVVPVSVCGVGVGVLAPGSTATCDSTQTTPGGENPGGNNPGGNDPGHGGSNQGPDGNQSAVGSVLDTVLEPFGAGPSALAFTGGNSLWILGLAVIMLVVGAGLKGLSPVRVPVTRRP
jgi:hypothetical protein